MGHEYDSNEHVDYSLADEEKPPLDVAPTNDPFGDESNGEVKYRTMGWW